MCTKYNKMKVIKSSNKKENLTDIQYNNVKVLEILIKDFLSSNNSSNWNSFMNSMSFNFDKINLYAKNFYDWMT